MLRSVAAFMVQGARILRGEKIKSACHGITTHPVNLWTICPSTVMEKAAGAELGTFHGKRVGVNCKAFGLYITRLFWGFCIQSLILLHHRRHFSTADPFQY